MKTSRKMSLASVAAIGLPVVGFAGAVAQGMPSGTQEATVAVTGGDELLLRSSTADLRSSGDVTLVANSNDELQIAADGIDPMRGWDEANLDAYAAYWEAGYNYNQLLALTEEWNLSEFEAKARAGAAILAGDTSSFEDIVAGIDPLPQELETFEPLTAGPADAFWDAGFTYDDAVALAEVWNIDSWDAKIMASEMISAGNQGDVEALLSA